MVGFEDRADIQEGRHTMKKGEKRKNELLQIAYSMFLTKGYENTSVDNIIEEAGMAKGTFYYYYQSKEQLLEAVCMMMIGAQADRARQILNTGLPIPQKTVGIIASFRPEQNEQTIGDTLNRPENVLMHDKINRQIVETIVPIVSEVVEEGIREGIFCCDNIHERVRMIIIISNTLFDDYAYTDKDIEVFIDLIEKLLGAAPGTMGFVKELINS